LELKPQLTEHHHDPGLVAKERKLKFLSVLRPLLVSASVVTLFTIIFILFPYSPPEGIEPASKGIPLLSWAAFTIFATAFACEYFDASTGMGYGTTLSPVLLLYGYRPLQIVPAILISELLAAGTAAFAHHSFGNVNFHPRNRDFRVAVTLGFCSLVGSVIAVIIAVSIPEIFLKTWIAGIVLLVGILILTNIGRVIPFSWWKIVTFGFAASFNKGMSGGGYGPLVTGAQLLSGVRSKTAIAVTALAEGITCAVGAITYYFTKDFLDWSLAPPMIIAVLCAVPLAALTVRALETKMLTVLIGVATITLGTVTLLKIYVF
jgi:uncharacterized membrane protein YfcA